MNKRTEKILELIDEIGIRKTKELLGISSTKLVKLADLKIHPGLAGDIIMEGIINKTLPTIYKEFMIETNMDGVVYWEGKLNTGHFLPHVIENISVMATPFWDDESYTPVETNWYSLTDSKKNTLIDEIDGGGEYFETINDKIFFDSVEDVYNWYEKFYLPNVYEIIMDNFLPNLRQDIMEDD